MRLALLFAASLIIRPGLGSRGFVIPEGCVASTKTASGVECPSATPLVAPALASASARTFAQAASVEAEGLTQLTLSNTDDPASVLSDNVTWSALAELFTQVSSPTSPVTSALGGTTVTASVGGSTNSFFRLNQSFFAGLNFVFGGWGGSFPPGMPLLSNVGNGPITFNFSQPIVAFAIYVQVSGYHNNQTAGAYSISGSYQSA